MAEWGDTSLVSSVHSVRKSIVSVLYGIAIERGLIDQSLTLAELGIDDVPPLTDQERQATLDDILASMSGIYHPSVRDDDEAGRPARGTREPGETFDGSAFFASGTGGQKVYIDPAFGLVFVVKVNTGEGFTRGLWWNYGPNITYGQFTELVALLNSAAPSADPN